MAGLELPPSCSATLAVWVDGRVGGHSAIQRESRQKTDRQGAGSGGVADSIERPQEQQSRKSWGGFGVPTSVDRRFVWTGPAPSLCVVPLGNRRLAASGQCD